MILVFHSKRLGNNLDQASVSSAETYQSEVFARDNQIMNYKITFEEVMNQIVILRDRFDKTFRDLEDMSNDPLVVAMARMKARHLAAERCLMSHEAPL